MGIERIIRYLDGVHQPVVEHVPHPRLSFAECHNQTLAAHHAFVQTRLATYHSVGICIHI